MAASLDEAVREIVRAVLGGHRCAAPVPAEDGARLLTLASACELRAASGTCGRLLGWKDGAP